VSASADVDACPCGGDNYAQCCGRFLAGAAVPQSAEQLMRSRYTAYTRRDHTYLAATWARQTRPPTAPIADDGTRWLGLVVRDTSTDGDTATVEFVARYKLQGRAHRLHEISRFVRTDERWFYLDGSFPESAAKR
jgi:SEC-C motif-containing protein